MISKLHNLFKNNRLYLFFNNLRYNSIIKDLQNKKKINVIFLINHISQWKYHSLFNIYKKNNKYSVKVIFIPVDDLSGSYLDKYTFNKKEFSKIGVHLISSYNTKKKLWKNINKSFSPDIIFLIKA